MDRGGWQATIHRVAESDTIEVLSMHAQAADTIITQQKVVDIITDSLMRKDLLKPGCYHS